jgi:hypothetical protein
VIDDSIDLGIDRAHAQLTLTRLPIDPAIFTTNRGGISLVVRLAVRVVGFIALFGEFGDDTRGV